MSIGSIGALAFAFCGVPQAVKSYREGHCDGISSLMIALWMVGAVFMFVYVTVKYYDLMLMANYILNMAVAGTMAYFKWRPRALRSR